VGKRRPREGNLAKVLQGLGCTREQLEEVAWRLHRGWVLAGLPDPSGDAGAAPAPGSFEDDSLAELRARLRAMLAAVADPLGEVLVIAVRAALSDWPTRRRGAEPGRPRASRVFPAKAG
jgi:hypothetical protein